LPLTLAGLYSFDLLQLVLYAVLFFCFFIRHTRNIG